MTQISGNGSRRRKRLAVTAADVAATKKWTSAQIKSPSRNATRGFENAIYFVLIVLQEPINSGSRRSTNEISGKKFSQNLSPRTHYSSSCLAS